MGTSLAMLLAAATACTVAVGVTMQALPATAVAGLPAPSITPLPTLPVPSSTVTPSLPAVRMHPTLRYTKLQPVWTSPVARRSWPRTTAAWS